MKFLKYIFAAAMALMSVFSWKKTADNVRKDDELYTECLMKAHYHEEKGAYVTAAEYYKKALEYDPDNYSLVICAAESCLLSGNSTDFESYCKRAAGLDPEEAEPYILLSDYYCENDEYDTALKILKSAPECDVISNMMHYVCSVYRDEYRTYDDVKGFYNGYCAFSNEEGEWGLISEKGGMILPCEFDDVGAYSSEADAVPVCSDGEWYFADINGKRKYVPEEPYETLGAFSEGYAPFKRNGMYGYTDLDYNEKAYGLEFAGAFCNGTAAVKKDGKWALIGSDLKYLTGFEYDLIETDEYGFCYANGDIWACSDGKRICIDRKGKIVSPTETPVCGLLPAERNGKWGYNDDEGTPAIDAIYEKTLPFTENGRALVKQEGRWHIIILRVKESHSIL